jgi:hypothetical protein
MSIGSPVMLLQWLNPGEHEETRSMLAEFAASVDIAHEDVKDPTEARSAIQRWLDGNNNAQFLFIGTHGDEDGLGPTVANGVEWGDFRDWMSAEKPVVLWLGACKSSAAASGLSPVPSGPLRIEAIFGFSEDVYPPEIETVLKYLLDRASKLDTRDFRAEFHAVMQLLPGSSLEAFVPRHADGENRYVHVDDA